MAKGDQNNANTVFQDTCTFRENLRLAMASETSAKSETTAVETAIEALRFYASIDVDTHRLKCYIPIHKLADLKHRIVHSAAKMMEMSPIPKIGTCAADDCDWLFIDNSKSKRRRWCDTKTCGNRARVKQFRAQTH
jgi:predicted RNA-binding Zn ribbon-like protein